jgi:hypothetical protein
MGTPAHGMPNRGEEETEQREDVEGYFDCILGGKGVEGQEKEGEEVGVDVYYIGGSLET